MSEGGGPVVGVVGDADGTIAEAVADAGGRPTTGSTADVLSVDPSVVVARGERAVIDVATRSPSAPILPVAAGRGVRSVPSDDLDDAASRLIDGDWASESHPLLAVAVDGEPAGVAVLDFALVTAEAAHISEYEIAAGETRLGRVRADGVVVATPAGAPGYARRLGGPVLAPETGAVVAPIAPFATDPDHWVVDPDGLTLTLERDEAPVDLVVDDTVVRSLDPSETVSCTVDGSVSTLVLPESRPRYD